MHIARTHSPMQIKRKDKKRKTRPDHSPFPPKDKKSRFSLGVARCWIVAVAVAVVDTDIDTAAAAAAASAPRPEYKAAHAHNSPAATADRHTAAVPVEPSRARYSRPARSTRQTGHSDPVASRRRGEGRARN